MVIIIIIKIIIEILVLLKMEEIIQMVILL